MSKHETGLPHGAKGERLADQLSRMILSGRYGAGERLVESALALELGVSRGLVREAFRRLAADGLIEIVPNRGALVRRLTRRDALELFEIRTEMEVFAARRAAARMSDDCARAIFARAASPIREDGPRDSVDAYISENRAFHRALLEASGNGQLVQIHERLQLSLLLSQIRGSITQEVMRISVTEHRAIARAVLEGDAAGAEAAVRAHLERAAGLMRGSGAEAFRLGTKSQRQRALS